MSNIATAHEARERAIFRNISNNAALLAALATVSGAVEKAAEAGLFSVTVMEPHLSPADAHQLTGILRHLGYELSPWTGFDHPVTVASSNCAGDCNPGGRCLCKPTHGPMPAATRNITISWSV